MMPLSHSKSYQEQVKVQRIKTKKGKRLKTFPFLRYISLHIFSKGSRDFGVLLG